MKKMLRTVFILVVGLALALGGWLAYQQYQQKQTATAQASAATVQITRGDLTTTVGATGTARTNQSAVVSWATSGTVATISVTSGQVITQGQVLATLEQSSLPQEVIDGAADLASAKQALADLYTTAESSKVTAMSNIITYEEAYRDAQYDLDNFIVPVNQAGLSVVDGINTMKANLDQARAAFEPYKLKASTDSTRQDLLEALATAQADYNAAIKRMQLVYHVEVAQSNLDKAQADYKKWADGPQAQDILAAESKVAAAQALLDQAQLVAPFAGTVTDVGIDERDLVSEGTQAFRIDDLSQFLMDVSVSEVDINRMQIGQTALLTFDAISGKEYHASVIKISQIGSSSSGVVNFDLTLKLTDADAQVKSGMTAAVELVVSQATDVLLVPNRSIKTINAVQYIYLVRDGQAVQTAVTVQATDDIYSQITADGIQVGDEVLQTPPSTSTTTSSSSAFNLGIPGLGGSGPAPAEGGAGGPPAN